jgi:SAM-dependent methyltransferase
VRDVLLYGLSESQAFADLLAWSQTTPGVSFPAPDPHRLQLEHWVWSHRDQLGTDILDVGVINRREYLGPGYRTVGEYTEDVRADVCALPMPAASFDGVVLTEVLEHCRAPFEAMREVRRVLRPGGLLLVTSPFLWPWHGTDEYQDYWRFTHQGWQLLLQPFVDVSITPCTWTPEAEAGYAQMRRFECMGFASLTRAHTAYLCSARKPAA